MWTQINMDDIKLTRAKSEQQYGSAKFSFPTTELIPVPNSLCSRTDLDRQQILRTMAEERMVSGRTV